MPTLIHLQITLLHVTNSGTLLLSLLFWPQIHLSTKAISTIEYLIFRQEVPWVSISKAGFSSLSWVILVDEKTTPLPTDLVLCWDSFLNSPLQELCLWSPNFCPLPFCSPSHFGLLVLCGLNFKSPISRIL